MLLHITERPAARVINPDGRANIVLVCEHAARFIPKALNNLGLDTAAQSSHAAWDIGALELAQAMSVALDAPLVAGRVSRLVYDCNRPPESPDAVPVQSESISVPGNVGLSAEDRAARVAEVYRPFEALLAGTVAVARRKAADGPPPAIVTVHSFTPVYFGKPRSTELGLLHDADDQMALDMLHAAAGRTALKTELNAPYSAKDGVTHTLKVHATAFGLPNVMIEVRNDLLADAAGIAQIALDLSAMVGAALATQPAAASH
jgi:predicted N-formylglutamate amidohydrolase